METKCDENIEKLIVDGKSMNVEDNKCGTQIITETGESNGENHESSETSQVNGENHESSEAGQVNDESSEAGQVTGENNESSEADQGNDINYESSKRGQENGENHESFEAGQVTCENQESSEASQVNGENHESSKAGQVNGENHESSEADLGNGVNHESSETGQENGENHESSEADQVNGENHESSEAGQVNDESSEAGQVTGENNESSEADQGNDINYESSEAGQVNGENNESSEADLGNGVNHESSETGQETGVNHESSEAGQVNCENHESSEAGQVNGEKLETPEAVQVKSENHETFEAGQVNGVNHESSETGQVTGVNHEGSDKGQVTGVNHERLKVGQIKVENCESSENIQNSASKSSSLTQSVGNAAMKITEDESVNTEEPESFGGNDSEGFVSDSSLTPRKRSWLMASNKLVVNNKKYYSFEEGEITPTFLNVADDSELTINDSDRKARFDYSSYIDTTREEGELSATYDDVSEDSSLNITAIEVKGNTTKLDKSKDKTISGMVDIKSKEDYTKCIVEEFVAIDRIDDITDDKTGKTLVGIDKTHSKTDKTDSTKSSVDDFVTIDCIDETNDKIGKTAFQMKKTDFTRFSVDTFVTIDRIDDITNDKTENTVLRMDKTDSQMDKTDSTKSSVDEFVTIDCIDDVTASKTGKILHKMKKTAPEMGKFDPNSDKASSKLVKPAPEMNKIVSKIDIIDSDITHEIEGCDTNTEELTLLKKRKLSTSDRMNERTPKRRYLCIPEGCGETLSPIVNDKRSSDQDDTTIDQVTPFLEFKFQHQNDDICSSTPLPKSQFDFATCRNIITPDSKRNDLTKIDGTKGDTKQSFFSGVDKNYDLEEIGELITVDELIADITQKIGEKGNSSTVVAEDSEEENVVTEQVESHSKDSIKKSDEDHIKEKPTAADQGGDSMEKESEKSLTLVEMANDEDEMVNDEYEMVNDEDNATIVAIDDEELVPKGGNVDFTSKKLNGTKGIETNETQSVTEHDSSGRFKDMSLYMSRIGNVGDASTNRMTTTSVYNDSDNSDAEDDVDILCLDTNYDDFDGGFIDQSMLEKSHMVDGLKDAVKEDSVNAEVVDKDAREKLDKELTDIDTEKVKIERDATVKMESDVPGASSDLDKIKVKNDDNDNELETIDIKPLEDMSCKTEEIAPAGFVARDIIGEWEKSSIPPSTSSASTALVSTRLEHDERVSKDFDASLYDCDQFRRRISSYVESESCKRWGTTHKGVPYGDVNLTLATTYHNNRLLAGEKPKVGFLERGRIVGTYLYKDDITCKLNEFNRPIIDERYMNKNFILKRLECQKQLLLNIRNMKLEQLKIELESEKADLKRNHYLDYNCLQNNQAFEVDNTMEEVRNYTNLGKIQTTIRKMYARFEKERNDLRNKYNHKFRLLNDEGRKLYMRTVTRHTQQFHCINDIMNQINCYRGNFNEILPYGPPVNIRVRKGPCIETRWKHSLVEVNNLPAAVARALILEDDLYDYHYRY